MQTTPKGRPLKTPGQHGFYAYHPAALPRSLLLDEPTVKLLSDADNALRRLAGAGRLLRNPHLLATLCILKEAVASSRIEGILSGLKPAKFGRRRWVAREILETIG